MDLSQTVSKFFIHRLGSCLRRRSATSSGEALCNVRPLRLRSSTVLITVSVIDSWVSSEPPTKLKPSPWVMRLCLSVPSSPMPRSRCLGPCLRAIGSILDCLTTIQAENSLCRLGGLIKLGFAIFRGFARMGYATGILGALAVNFGKSLVLG